MTPRTKGLLFYGSLLLLVVGYQAYKRGLSSALPTLDGRSDLWLGLRPLKCYGNQTIHVQSRVRKTSKGAFTDPLEATLTAMGHCHVIVENSRLSGDNPFVALDHSLVTLRNSELDCDGIGDCIAAQGHARVELDHSTIRTNVNAHTCPTCDQTESLNFGTGVDVMQNASLVMNGGTIEAGGGDAIEAHDTASVELHGVTLHARVVVDKWKHESGTALELKDAAIVDVFDSDLDASPPAIWIEGPVSIALRDTKVVGGWHAYHAKSLSGLPKNAYPGDGAR